MIHPTACISPDAELAPDVFVGPFAVIEDGVRIGPGSRIEAHAQILRGVTMGAGNLVDRAAILGGNPQSLGFDPASPSGVRIGDHNTFREHITVHRSLERGGFTVIGDHNFLMAGAHLGHDVLLGSHSVIANAVLVAGHVEIGQRCFLGGGAVFHQFIRIGDYAMVQGNACFSADIPPFCVASGVNQLSGLNVVGLRRAGFDSAARLDLKRAWQHTFRAPAGPVKAAAAALADPATPAVTRPFYQFVAECGRKGLCTPVGSV